MKIQNNILHSSIINLHGQDWIDKQRVAGQCLADVMDMLGQLVLDKTTMSLRELDSIAHDEIIKRDCTPTFLGYRGFSASVCMSVNKQLVHGIPGDYILKDGDLITFDFGATYRGAIADSAMTYIYGEPSSSNHIKLIDITQECLYAGIRAIGIGKRIGVIGNAIYKTARNAGFNVISRFGGHGLDWDKPHAEPFVSNQASPEDGIHIVSGMTIAIEPLLVPGNCTTDTKMNSDGWTISTDDISAHAEHSIFIHSDHVEIMSWRAQESKISKKVYFK